MCMCGASMVQDPEKFPLGMRYISDYLGARNISLGLYTTPGNLYVEALCMLDRISDIWMVASLY